MNPASGTGAPSPSAERMTPGYFLACCWFRIFFATYQPRTIYHVERVPKSGPAILAANHVSLIDPPLVGTATRRVLHYLARESAFTNPIAGAILRSWNCVPLDRDGGSARGLKTILEHLRNGQAIMMFPEGTRSPDGKIQSARPGIGLAIVKSGAPVIPIRVFGTFELFGRKHLLPRPGCVAVKFGKALDFADARAQAADCTPARRKEIYQEVSDALMAAIGALQPTSDDAG
ncbi:MAG: 1-acyl-sn-glycerol-3-phosphate acyltransferase [Pedosphaera sp.]|nr:1-acyl-sn-glycerol-3-phosphate acyltransferase [Pedosphaera sp.]MSU43158.1 1-acyl-sn-glycerol-3-phosphate acyltransferase [Pedosphaera sp.]